MEYSNKPIIHLINNNVILSKRFIELLKKVIRRSNFLKQLKKGNYTIIIKH